MTDINASIIDQQLSGILENHQDLLPATQAEFRQRSAAFLLLCVASLFGISLNEASEFITDGGNDEGVDAIHYSDVDDGEFLVTLFQSKYKSSQLDGTAHFPENSVGKAIQTINGLFDPNRKLELNPSLQPKIEEIRSLIRDGFIPTIRIILCNNGRPWNDQAQQRIDQAGFQPDQVSWVHFNHDSIVNLQKRRLPVNETLRLSGKAIIEEFNYRRVMIGKIPVTEIAKLFNEYGDRLLERNIRRYLGLHTNRVNSAIHETLNTEANRANFYFFNNGITMICNKFRHNALQAEDFSVQVEGMQIINGGQTCKTIQQTLSEPDFLKDFRDTFVLFRLYELAENDTQFIHDITYATNSQNPVDLRDLRSNDPVQQQLEIGLKDLEYTYKRQRDDSAATQKTITSAVLAESVLAIWRRMPQQAKFRRREHFGKLYDTIFQDINVAQGLLAVMIFRYVETLRKRNESPENTPRFLPYASHYIAMLIGDQILKSQDIGVGGIDHRNLQSLLGLFESQQEQFYTDALDELTSAVQSLYGNRPIKDISLQQLSATFRRGDLLEFLQ